MVKERELVIAQAISQLSERKRDALMRCVIQGESLAVIAKDHGVSARTTRRDVQEALRLLQSLLKRVGT